MKPKYYLAISIVILLAVGIIYVGYTSVLNTDSSGATIVKTQTKAKPFETQTIQGSKYKFTPSKQLTIFEVFASWCLPCRKSVPEAVNFQKNNKDATVVGIAYRDVDFEVKKFQDRFGSFETTIKSNGSVEDALGINDVPQTLFVVDGEVVYRLYGSASETDIENVYSLVKREFLSSQ